MSTAVLTRSGQLARSGRRPRAVPVPRAQSLVVQAGPEQTVGPTELGRITVADSVVAKLASRAAVEIDDVGAAAPRLLGREIAGGPLDRLGVKSSELGALPSAGAQVDGQLAFVTLTLSVRYPAPVRQVCAAVREQVQRRVAAMTGLRIVEVDITVPALLAELPRPPRVR